VRFQRAADSIITRIAPLTFLRRSDLLRRHNSANCRFCEVVSPSPMRLSGSPRSLEVAESCVWRRSFAIRLDDRSNRSLHARPEPRPGSDDVGEIGIGGFAAERATLCATLGPTIVFFQGFAKTVRTLSGILLNDFGSALGVGCNSG